MAANILAFVVLFLLAVAVALATYLLIRKSLRALLDSIVPVPECTTFYTRLLAIGLFFVALWSSLSADFNLKSDAAFMEYVWKIASGLANCFGVECLFLTGYLFVVTILVVVLGRKGD